MSFSGERRLLSGVRPKAIQSPAATVALVCAPDAAASDATTAMTATATRPRITLTPRTTLASLRVPRISAQVRTAKTKADEHSRERERDKGEVRPQEPRRLTTRSVAYRACLRRTTDRRRRTRFVLAVRAAAGRLRELLDLRPGRRIGRVARLRVTVLVVDAVGRASDPDDDEPATMIAAEGARDVRRRVPRCLPVGDEHARPVGGRAIEEAVVRERGERTEARRGHGDPLRRRRLDEDGARERLIECRGADGREEVRQHAVREPGEAARDVGDGGVKPGDDPPGAYEPRTAAGARRRR